MLNAITLNVIMLNVVTLIVMVPVLSTSLVGVDSTNWVRVPQLNGHNNISCQFVTVRAPFTLRMFMRRFANTLQDPYISVEPVSLSKDFFLRFFFDKFKIEKMLIYGKRSMVGWRVSSFTN
jgi:hypothetical protein